MIAKWCKRSAQQLYRQEPKRHDEDWQAGVLYSLCHSQIILVRSPEHTHPSAFYVGVSQ